MNATTQAIEWHQRLKQGELDADARAEFRAWMESPENVTELARICLIDASLASLQGGTKRQPRRSLPKNVIDFGSYAPAATPRAQLPVATAKPSGRKTRIAAAASVLLVLVIGTLATLLTADRVIDTRQGAWDKQLLDDGTVVYAGPRTRLQFRFDDRTRGVELLRGEALFEVAREPRRPFIVSTDAGRVQALGTVFATVDTGDDVIVTVMEGKVAVNAAEGAQPMIPLSANQQVVLSRRRVSQPIAVNAERELKWIRDWYEYDGEPVGEIIAELNRRHEVRIVVDDPQVLRLRMNGLSFQPSRPEDFVAKINQWYAGYPNKTRLAGARSDGAVHLQRR